MGHFDRARSYLVENRLLVLSSLLTILLLVLHIQVYHPDPHFEHALDATVVIRAGSGYGTGFFINKEGCVMTAAHVIIESATKGKPIFIEVRGHSYKIPMRVEAVNGYLDIALICTNGVPAQSYLEIADTENIREGEPVYALGHPDNRTWNVTNGIVSRMGFKEHTFGAVSIPRWDMWFSAFISWGNSGGPVINSYGKVVGMVVEWDDPGIGKPNNMNLAVPGSDLRRFIRGVWGKY